MQKARDLIRVGHVPQPSAPCCTQESIAEAHEHEDDDKDGIGRVYGQDGVGDKVASGTNDGDSALAELDVYEGIHDRSEAEAYERGEKDEGYDNIA